MKSSILEFNNVSKIYGQFEAVKSLSFAAEKGEILAFLGPNGAGKSTTLQCLLGLKRPTNGTIRLFEGAPTDLGVRKRVGATPQDLDFPPQLKVKEIFEHVEKAFKVKMSPDLLRSLNLENLLERRTAGLSGGERRRLGLCCALIGNPELLVLDEPTTGLDVESRRLLWDLIKKVKRAGTTVLLTTHYLEEVESLAQRVILIDRGLKMFEGGVDQIKATVDYRKVQFSTPASQLPSGLPVENFEKNGDRWTLWTRQSDLVVKTLVGTGFEFSNLQVSGASLEEAVIQLRKRSP